MSTGSSKNCGSSFPKHQSSTETTSPNLAHGRIQTPPLLVHSNENIKYPSSQSKSRHPTKSPLARPKPLATCPDKPRSRRGPPPTRNFTVATSFPRRIEPQPLKPSAATPPAQCYSELWVPSPRPTKTWCRALSEGAESSASESMVVSSKRGLSSPRPQQPF